MCYNKINTTISDNMRGGSRMEEVKAVSILHRNKTSGWFGTDYNMNLYRGCCHGCIYCDSRSDCYGIGDFDSVRCKANSLEILRDELRRKVHTGVIGTGAMSDPYNPYEEKALLTRHAPELIDAYGFGCAVLSKSALMTRDIDIFLSVKEHSPMMCKLTVTTADDELCKKLEPNVSVSSERFEALAKMSDSGLFTGITMMPVLPFIEDSEENIRSIVPGERLSDKYIHRFGNSYECTCPNVKVLWKAFTEECEKYGILYKMQDIISASKLGYEYDQMSLF